MTILCYHAVGTEWPPPLTVPTGDFESQCAWLVRSKGVRPLADLLDDGVHGGPVALTFDDGSEDLYHNALPVLRSLELPATVFLVARTLVSPEAVVDWVDGTPPGVLRTLSIEQIREMREAGVRFGSHTYAHHDLTTLSEAECVDDLRMAREVLEDALREPVPLLAYPRGRHVAHVRRAAARAGYSHALALPEGGPEVADRFAIPRVGVFTGNDLRALAAKTNRFYLRARTHRLFPAMRSLRRVVRRRGRTQQRLPS